MNKEIGITWRTHKPNMTHKLSGREIGTVVLVIFATQIGQENAVVWPQEAKNARILISALRFTLFDPCCKDH